MGRIFWSFFCDSMNSLHVFYAIWKCDVKQNRWKMPLFQREHVQFALLFLCVPIQYFIVQNSGSSESSCTHLIVKQIQDFQRYWLSLVSWTKWCKKLLLDRADPGTGDSIAITVLHRRDIFCVFWPSLNFVKEKCPFPPGNSKWVIQKPWT